MNESDNIQRFIFEHQAIRGEIAHLTQSYADILSQHPYPPIIQQLLGELLVATALLTATIKFSGNLTIQFHGNEPIRLLVAKCNDQFHLRGLAQYDETATDYQFAKTFGQGKLVITIDTQQAAKPYQSIVPLQGLSVSQCLENYFAQSEQLATKIYLKVEATHAAGILLQLLPSNDSQEREHFWQYGAKISGTNTAINLFTLTNEALLQQLFPEVELRVFERQAIIFKCSCNLEKMQRAIITLGQAEADAILSTKQQIEVCCEYCNHKYSFNKMEVASIFAINKK